LKVKATPRIHEGGEVTLQLEFDITSLATQSFNTIPAINNQSLQQTVRLKEGETSVIAGLLASQKSTNVNGTPGIVGLPGLGWLAQDQTKSDSSTELLFLVTPRMVRFPSRKDRIIYAGAGALEGQGAAPVAAPPAPPPTLGLPGLAGQPQPGQGPSQTPAPGEPSPGQPPPPGTSPPQPLPSGALPPTAP
jgi:general secretion pathway protein D